MMSDNGEASPQRQEETSPLALRDKSRPLGGMAGELSRIGPIETF